MWEFDTTIRFDDTDTNPNFVITKEGIYLLTFASLLVIIGIATNLPIFYTPGLVVLITFLLVLIPLLRSNHPPLTINITIPSIQIKAKQFLTLHIDATSEEYQSLFIEFECSSGLIEVLRKPNGVLRPESGGSSWVFYAPRRGKENIHSIFVQLDGLFGLFYIGKKIEIDREIIVLPQPQRVTLPWKIKQRIFDQFLAEIEVNRKGRGDTFLSLREFQYGDEIRHIHWKATAKHNKLISKEFEEPIMLRFLIVVDKSLLMSGTKLEFALSSIVELASVIRRSNHSLTILVHGDKTTWKYDLGTSPSSFNQMGIRLHSINAEGPNFNFDALREYIINHDLTDSVILLISDLEHDPEELSAGYTALKPYFQRLIYFACYTPGFGTMAYNKVTGKKVDTRNEYYHRKYILTPKLNRVYEQRSKEYAAILQQSMSRFHVIKNYNTNILLELKETLELMSKQARRGIRSSMK